VIAMMHADIAQAVGQARREDMVRAATGRTSKVRTGRGRRGRLIAWLEGQRLGHRRLPAAAQASALSTCAAVTR
jgi:hypothetical protein